MPTIKTVERPYTLTFTSTGHRYPLTSEEAQRLIDEYPLTYASQHQVGLRGDGRGTNTILRAAALGGGPAFIVTY